MASNPEYNPIVGPEAYSEEWYAARRSCIGASDAAAACGMSEHRQPLDLYLEMRGLVEPVKETPAMRIGKELEPVILNLYAHEVECVVRHPLPMYFSPAHPFIGATPDALARFWFPPEDQPDPGEWLVEAKSTNQRRAKAEIGAEEMEEVPTDWLFQVQQQMHVLGKPFADIAVLVDANSFRRVRIKRNEELIAAIIAAEEDLWERVQHEDPPPPQFSHPRAADLMRKAFALDPAKTVTLPANVLDFCVDYVNLGQAGRDIDKKRKEAKARILYAMGDAAIGECGSVIVKRSLVTRAEYVVKETTFPRLTVKGDA